MYVGNIGQKFSEAGLRDFIVQNDVLAKGSFDKVVSGTIVYNRAVLVHKLGYEKMLRFLLRWITM